MRILKICIIAQNWPRFYNPFFCDKRTFQNVSPYNKMELRGSGATTTEDVNERVNAIEREQAGSTAKTQENKQATSDQTYNFSMLIPKGKEANPETKYVDAAPGSAYKRI